MRIRSRDLAVVGRAIRERVPKGQRRVHLSSEGDRRRRQILRAFATLDIAATVYRTPYDRKSNDQPARDRCLRALISDVVVNDVPSWCSAHVARNAIGGIVGPAICPGQRRHRPGHVHPPRLTRRIAVGSARRHRVGEWRRPVLEPTRKWDPGGAKRRRKWLRLAASGAMLDSEGASRRRKWTRCSPPY